MPSIVSRAIYTHLFLQALWLALLVAFSVFTAVGVIALVRWCGGASSLQAAAVVLSLYLPLGSAALLHQRGRIS